MGLRIIAGPPGSGKTHRIIGEILEENARDPLGPPLILLVPEQSTYQAERLLIASGAAGYVRVEVLSFARLGRWIEARRPRAQLPVLGDAHREVIVTGVLARLRREGTGEGLAMVPHLESSVASLLGEMKQGNVRTGELMDWAAKVEGERPALARKLVQIAEVARQFEEAVARRFESPEDTMLELASSVEGLNDLQGAHVYVDSFYGFTAVEREVLRGLLSAFPEVTVSVVLDRPLADAMTKQNFSQQNSGRCAPSLETLRQLVRLAEQETSSPPAIVDQEPGSSGRFAASEMKFLSREFLAGPRRTNWMDSAPNLKLIEALDFRDQARVAAMQIEAWHRERGWHWGEMAIIARDVDSVAQELGEAMEIYRIPHFMDRHQPEATHPAIQGCLSAMEVILRGWRQQDILAFAKSGLHDFDEHAVARLEWFVLQHPRRESDWKLEEQWGEPPERSPFEPGEGRRFQVRDMSGLDAVRREIVTPLRDLQHRVQEVRTEDGEFPARAMVEALCHLMHSGLQPRIERLIDDGELELAEAEQDVLGQIGVLLDTIATAAGEDTFSEPALLDLFRSILGKFRLQRIPPLLDHVVVGQADRSRLPEVRGVVVIGLAEGEFPAPGSNRTLLSDDDREVLAKLAVESTREKEIRASARELFRREAFFAWMSMSRASEAMTLIRPSVNRSGDSLKASPWWFEVQRLFPKVIEERTSDTPAAKQVARAREVASLVCTKWGGTTARVPPLDSSILSRHAFDLELPSDRDEFQRVTEWATRRNTAMLDAELMCNALDEDWSASATGLEAFASCPFQFFMRTVMRPDIRQETQASRMDLGNLAHAVLKEVFDRLRESDEDLGELDDQAVISLLAKSFAAPLGRMQKAGLLDTPLGEIQAELIQVQIVEVVRHFQLLAQQTRLRNISTEIAFSKAADSLQPPRFQVTLANGTRREIHLRGQIDRVDEWGDGGWLFVLDYKLSARKMDWTAVMDGKSLQLPIYLLVLEENLGSLSDSNARVGGAFYEAIAAASEKSNRMRGVIAQSALQELGLDEKDVPFRITGARSKIDGKQSGDVMQDGHMAALMEWSRERIIEHLRGIFSGKCSVNPVRIKNTTPCSYCDHRMACRYDTSMNTARVPQIFDKLDALARMSGGEVGDPDE